jgi:amino acid adenylation domain-containing protein
MIDAMPSATWNQTDRAYPDVLLHEAFAAQVARDPSAPAVTFRDETLTYGQFDERVNELALHLVGLGVTRDTLVAVCIERSLEMLVALHAVLRAGGAYVPIDPEYPDERISLMLEDLDEPILLVQGRLAGRFAGTAVRAIVVDAPLPPTELAATELPKVSPDDLAYVIFTSGSTGRPKGAMNTHGAIANRIYWQQEHFRLTPEERLLQKTPLTFDTSLWECFWPFMYGAHLTIAEPGGHRDTAYLCQTVIEQGITFIHFVPSMLRLFLEDPRVRDCVTVRRVISSGEALSRTLQDRFFERLDAELHNLYGPTECANDVSYWVCDQASPLPFVPIGKPMGNTQLHILDADMQPIPVGEVGELHIGGVHVGRGYLNRPELTAERFVTDPFRPGGTLYKTGDLARHLPDGNIEFLGRSDFQVKIRGLRVELGEIEAALEALDGVGGAVVVAHERPAGDLELIGYVEHQEGAGVSVDSLRTALAERLPDYMVPSTIVGLERFPLNSNLKVDRKALPAPPRTRPQIETPYAAPRTALQRLIAERWCRILQLDRVGIHDRFFELGGTSLDAARFVNDIQSELGETIFVFTLFGAPSVAEFAAFLERTFPVSVARALGAGPVPEPASAATRRPDEAAEVPQKGRSPSSRSPRSRELLTRQLDRRRAVQRGRG